MSVASCHKEVKHNDVTTRVKYYFGQVTEIYFHFLLKLAQVPVPQIIDAASQLFTYCTSQSSRLITEVNIVQVHMLNKGLTGVDALLFLRVSHQ